MHLIIRKNPKTSPKQGQNSLNNFSSKIKLFKMTPTNQHQMVYRRVKAHPSIKLILRPDIQPLDIEELGRYLASVILLQARCFIMLAMPCSSVTLIWRWSGRGERVAVKPLLAIQLFTEKPGGKSNIFTSMADNKISVL